MELRVRMKSVAVNCWPEKCLRRKATRAGGVRATHQRAGNEKTRYRATSPRRGRPRVHQARGRANQCLTHLAQGRSVKRAAS